MWHTLTSNNRTPRRDVDGAVLDCHGGIIKAQQNTVAPIETPEGSIETFSFVNEWTLQVSFDTGV